MIRHDLQFETLIRHLNKSNVEVQLNTLTVMNSLFLKADSLVAAEIAKVCLCIKWEIFCLDINRRSSARCTNNKRVEEGCNYCESIDKQTIGNHATTSTEHHL
jgi:hypothetical protein